MSLESLFAFPVIAEALITWTPLTFYIAASILHTILFLVGFRLLGVDPEHNTFVGAVLAAGIANGAAYFLRDFGLFGILGSASIHFALLVAITSGEVLKSAFVFFIAMALYAGMGFFIMPRTPLDVNQIGGLPRVVMTGGVEPEPITEEEADKLSAPAGKEK